MSVAFVTTDIHREDNATRQMVRWIRHESYKQFPYMYDLALMETELIISFNHFVHPAVMFYGDMYLVESQLECAIIGWNDSFISAETMIYFTLLAKADVRILEKDACEKLFPKYKSVVCAVPTEPLDLCGIDPGTPLACGVMNIWIFLGLYIDVNTCSSGGQVFLFRKIDEMHEWLQTLSNGAYVIDGNNLNRTKTQSAASYLFTRSYNRYIFLIILATNVKIFHV